MLEDGDLKDLLALPWASRLRWEVMKVLRCLRIFWKVAL